jgi:uncharacterized membrane protein (DUF4010 family)
MTKLRKVVVIGSAVQVAAVAALTAYAVFAEERTTSIYTPLVVLAIFTVGSIAQNLIASKE